MLTELDAKGWELYNLNEDFAEMNNLAVKERARLIAMIGMWYNEAGKYNVLPIDSRGLQRIREERPQIAVKLYHVKSKAAVPAGRHFLSVEFEPTGKPDFSQGKGAPVTPEYKSPFHFTGAIKRVIVHVSGEHDEDYEAQMRIVLAKQ
jgi:hypothetical protein